MKLLTGLLTIFLVFLSGCSLGSSELRIGVSAPLSGEIAKLGQSTKNAILIAEAEINATGGIMVQGAKRKVKFIIEDDRNNPETTARVFEKLIKQEKVLAIIGSQSSKCSNAGAPIAEKARVPQISPWSTNPNVTKGRSFVFRACFIDPFQGKVVAQYAMEKLQAKTAAVLYDVTNDYNKGIAEVFRDEFTKAGGTITGFETYQKNETDFSAQLTKIKTGNPELLFLPNYYNEVPLQVEQARQMGITAKIMGSDGWDNPDLLKLGGSLMNGTYFTNHYSPEIEHPSTQDFVAKYQNKYQAIPDAAAALTYDSAYLLFQALERAGKTDQKLIRDAIAQTQNFPGVTGEITYEDSGDPVKGAVIIGIKNEQFVFDSAVNQ